MGTPGDPSRIKEVKGTKVIQLEDQTRDDNSNTIASTSSSHNSEASTSEMTVIDQLPRFDSSFVGLQPQAATKDPNNGTTGQKLEQTYINDFYAEHKQSNSRSKKAENKEAFQETRSMEEPGPSGLQTPKKSKANLKRIKKTAAQSSKKSYTCHDCQQQFQNASKLSKHQQVHTNNAGSPFKCDYCKKTFSSKFKLVRHVLIHSDRKPFSCSVCERTFHRKDHLKNHIKVHSPCKKLYVCEKPTCKKEYTSSISYKKHLALHAAEDGILVCQICSKTFKSKEDILFHLKIHAGSRTVKNPEEKKYSCDYCSRKFFTRKDVRRHLVVHTGRRDFLCQFCPQRFGRKDHLVRHIKKSHSKAAETVVKEETETEQLQQQQQPEQLATPLSAEPAAPVKAEPGSDDVVFIKCETEDTQLSFATDLDLDPLFPINYLPQSSSQGEELADLGCGVLDVIPEASDDIEPDSLFSASEIGDSLIMDMLEKPTVEQTAPLPAFNIFFQPPTASNPHQPPPPQPPPQ